MLLHENKMLFRIIFDGAGANVLSTKAPPDIYVVFIPVILFGEFGLQSYLSSKVPQVFLI